MAYISVKSTNPDLGFIIKKNPSSPMLAVKHREGILFGWYDPKDHSNYNIFFKDQGNNSSYSPSDEKDYNAIDSFVSPMFVLDAISEFLAEPLKKSSDKDTDEFHNQIMVNGTVGLTNRMIEVFRQHFPDVTISEETTGLVKQLTFSTSKSLYYLTNYVAVLFSMTELKNTDMYVQSTILVKYLNCLNNIKAPYYIRYIFKYTLLKHKSNFTELKNLLDNNKFNFSFGDNYSSRVYAVKNRLNPSLPVIDVGCGEGRFMNAVCPVVPAYYGIDTDPLELEKSVNRKEKFGFENSSHFSSLSDLKSAIKDEKKVQALLIEVVEHMPKDSAESLVKEILAIPNLDSLTLTTPDHNFNPNYGSIKFRHPDHHYELTKSEFTAWILSLTPKEFSVEIFNVGDEVQGISTSIGAYFKKKVSN